MKSTSPTNEAGSSLLEYMMVLAFVAVFAIIGLRAVGSAAAGMFDGVTGGFSPPVATAPTEVLGTRLERPAAPVYTTRYSCADYGRATCPR